jgi:hypothetical protein
MDKKKWRLTKFKKEKHENLIVFKKNHVFSLPLHESVGCKAHCFFPSLKKHPPKNTKSQPAAAFTQLSS